VCVCVCVCVCVLLPSPCLTAQATRRARACARLVLFFTLSSHDLLTHLLSVWYACCGFRCAVERFIAGPYRKYNNNYGFVSEDERNTPQAFSHYTYETSQHRILICDIQV